jgi:hypothetical protein
VFGVATATATATVRVREESLRASYANFACFEENGKKRTTANNNGDAQFWAENRREELINNKLYRI